LPRSERLREGLEIFPTGMRPDSPGAIANPILFGHKAASCAGWRLLHSGSIEACADATHCRARLAPATQAMPPGRAPAGFAGRRFDSHPVSSRGAAARRQPVAHLRAPGLMPPSCTYAFTFAHPTPSPNAIRKTAMRARMASFAANYCEPESRGKQSCQKTPSARAARKPDRCSGPRRYRCPKSRSPAGIGVPRPSRRREREGWASGPRAPSGAVVPGCQAILSSRFQRMAFSSDRLLRRGGLKRARKSGAERRFFEFRPGWRCAAGPPFGRENPRRAHRRAG
jgi:hypothetical protein